MIILRTKSRAGATTLPVLLVLAAAFYGVAGNGVAVAQQQGDRPTIVDRIGRIFVRPQDGAAPATVRTTEEKVFDPDRRTMFKYETQDGPVTLYRDIWDEPGFGARSSAGLRFKF